MQQRTARTTEAATVPASFFCLAVAEFFGRDAMNDQQKSQPRAVASLLSNGKNTLHGPLSLVSWLLL